MKWTRSGKYAITSGEFTIAKAFIDGATLYYLTRGGGPAIKYDEDSDELKDLAGEIMDGHLGRLRPT